MRAAVVTAMNGPWEVQNVPEPKPVQIRFSSRCTRAVFATPMSTKRSDIFRARSREFSATNPWVRLSRSVRVYGRETSETASVLRGSRQPAADANGASRAKTFLRRPASHRDPPSGRTRGTHAHVRRGDTLLPEGLSYEQAAPIFCAGYTVWSGLRWANPKPHERVAVLGIGELGHLAVQYAKAAGFETIAISHSPDKDKMIRELGADEIVRDGKGLAAAGGADILLSTSNSTKAMVDSVQGLRPDGRLVTMGADAEPLAVSLMDLIGKQIQVIGSTQNGREYLYEALDFAAKGKVKVMAETYLLADAPKAYQRVAEGKPRFRAVLTM